MLKLPMQGLLILMSLETRIVIKWQLIVLEAHSEATRLDRLCY